MRKRDLHLVIRIPIDNEETIVAILEKVVQKLRGGEKETVAFFLNKMKKTRFEIEETDRLLLKGTKEEMEEFAVVMESRFDRFRLFERIDQLEKGEKDESIWGKAER